MSRFFALVACLLVASPQSSFAADSDLRLAPLAKDHKESGHRGEALKTGEELLPQRRRGVATASLIKLPDHGGDLLASLRRQTENWTRRSRSRATTR